MNLPNHSEQLREHFDISPIGVDWYNSFDIPIEFKETFSNNDINKITIKIGNHQLDDSDYIVVGYNHSEFYIHNAKRLKAKYKQNPKNNLTNIPFISLKNNYLFKTDNYKDLKKYLKNLK